MKHRDIKILLSLLLIFSFLIGVFYQSKTNKQEQNYHPLQEVLQSEATNYLSLLASSESVEAMVSLLQGLPISKIVILINQLINSGTMVKFDLLELVSALALKFPHDSEKIDLLFPLVLNYPSIKQHNIPILTMVASSMYTNSLDIWNQWIKRTHMPEATHLISNAYEYAVSMNRPDILGIYIDHTVFADQSTAQSLLWKVIEDSKDAACIPALIKSGADIHMPNERHITPLIRAAQKNNLAHVKSLIDAGADVNQMPSRSIGTALQAALEGAHSDIALLLRAHGAKD